jgi:hypothetical protein
MVGTTRGGRNIRGFVKAALEWCWAALLRSVSPAVRTVATDPATNREASLGPCCRFRLSSVVTSVSVDSTSVLASTKEIREFLDQRRFAFARGELFRPLEHAGRSGAVILSHITERGFTNAEHFLAVYPTDQPNPSTLAREL